MARKVRDKDLGDRTARERLKIQGKPHWRSIEAGLHIGYRRLRAKSGTWTARHYTGEKYTFDVIGTADDRSDADGVTVFSFDQAVTKARQLHTALANKAAGNHGPLTVDEALKAYVTYLDQEGKHTLQVEKTIPKYITPLIGEREVADLTSEDLNKWKADIAALKPRGRRAHDPRARKASANRIIGMLKSALNLAHEAGKVPSDRAWKKLKKFKNVERNRDRFLSLDECKRLINAADPDFRNMVQAALGTGARYAELCRLEVRDFHPDSGTVHIYTSRKSEKARRVYLTKEGQKLFESLAAGRRPHDTLIQKSTGLPFNTSNQIRRMVDTCERAGIEHLGFHQLRHTYASHLAMAGTPLMVIAESLGHATTAMTQRYAHLAPSHVADTIRANVPTFGFAKSNITTIKR